MMEEQKLKETNLLSEDEFKEYLDTNIQLLSFEGIRRFKSIRRAIRKGLVTKNGIIAPKRPFNNRANTSTRKGITSRVTNEYKKKVYNEYKNK